jgi:hypothetical protein
MEQIIINWINNGSTVVNGSIESESAESALSLAESLSHSI